MNNEQLLWCDECHYWHQDSTECPYNATIYATKALTIRQAEILHRIGNVPTPVSGDATAIIHPYGKP